MGEVTTRPCCSPGCPALVTSRAQKGYCDAHADKRSSWARHQAKKGNTTERGYGHAWRIVRARVLRRDKGLCQACLAQDRYRPASDVDHITSKALGGTDDEGNLQSLCRDCHKAKTANERHGKGEGVVKPSGLITK